jgi:hypothetical protein
MKTASPPRIEPARVQPTECPPATKTSSVTAPSSRKAPNAVDIMDAHEESSNNQLLQVSIAEPTQVTLEEDSDAMEEDQH